MVLLAITSVVLVISISSTLKAGMLVNTGRVKRAGTKLELIVSTLNHNWKHLVTGPMLNLPIIIAAPSQNWEKYWKSLRLPSFHLLFLIWTGKIPTKETVILHSPNYSEQHIFLICTFNISLKIAWKGRFFFLDKSLRLLYLLNPIDRILS